MITDTTKEKLVVYRISADGTEEELCEHEIDPTKTIGDTLFEMSLEQRTPYEAARFMLNMRDVKGNERRRLRAIVDKEACNPHSALRVCKSYFYSYRFCYIDKII